MSTNLDEARENVESTKAPTSEKRDSDDDEPRGPSATIEVVGDKGYHKAECSRS
jgi:hypothetical protein